MSSVSLIKTCLNILNEDNIKEELKNIYTPVIAILIQQLMPYMYLALIIILINFLLLLFIIMLLVKRRLPYFTSKA